MHGEGDIEDLAHDDAPPSEHGDGDGGEPRPQLLPAQQRRRRQRPRGDDRDQDDLDALADDAVGVVPGTARVWIRTMGCAHNAADSEQIAGVLMAQGYRVTMEGAAAAAAAADNNDNNDNANESSAKESADVWLLNSCTVKDPSEQAVGTFVREAAARGKAVVVAGCVPQAQKSARVLQPPPVAEQDGCDRGGRPIAVGLLGVAQLARAAEVVEAAVRGESLSLLGRGRGQGALPSAELPQARRNPHVAIVPLSQGCLGACTYCKTVHARGALSSYAPEEIEARVVAAARDPLVREIHLSSEDTGAYGRDRGTVLAALLERLTAALDRVAKEHGQVEEEDEDEEGEEAAAATDQDAKNNDHGSPRTSRRRPLHRVRLRIGMSNPPFLLRDGALDAVSVALRHPAVFRWLHLPVQSADDGVLARMNREYTAADFEEVVEGLQKRVPGLVVATDIIVGFPGEDDAAFERTLDLLRRHRFPSAHCTKFYPRPGTPAARYRPRVPTAVQKARSAVAAAVIEGRDLVVVAADGGAEAEAAVPNGKPQQQQLQQQQLQWSPYRDMVGTVQRVSVVDVASDGVSLVAHALNYAQVLLPPAPGLMGAVVDARILSASRWSVRGEVVRVLYSPPKGGARPAEEAGEVEKEEEGEQKGAAAAVAAPLSAAEAAAAARARVRAAREQRAKLAAAKAAAASEADLDTQETAPERDQQQKQGERPLEQQQQPAPPPPAETLLQPTASDHQSVLAPALVSVGLLLLAAALLMLGWTTLGDLARFSSPAAAAAR